jgi:2-hydroxy-3-oxopropionate reductase
MKVGFIGLGIMGKPMARNLLAAGHDMLVSTHNPAAAGDMAAHGAKIERTPQAIAAQTDVVITMLPNSPRVKEVALGSDGIIYGAHAGLIYIDMSSISPVATRQVSTALSETGITMLDAPVSGGEPKAVEGTLSIMVGGEASVFESMQDVFRAMGTAVHVGATGAGSTAKLVNQVIVAINIAAVAEGLVLAQKAGASPESVLPALRGGLAGSAVMEAKAPMMLEHNFRPGFRIGLHMKDLLNALETSHEVCAPLPLSAAVLEMFKMLKNDGHDADDHGGLVQYYEMLGGMELA